MAAGSCLQGTREVEVWDLAVEVVAGEEGDSWLQLGMGRLRQTSNEKWTKLFVEYCTLKFELCKISLEISVPALIPLSLMFERSYPFGPELDQR